MLPLAGITVVALEQAVAAPFATRQLADLGARVIKIERPGTGDFARDYDVTVNGMASHFVWLNRSKESLTLNLKTAEACEVLRRLLAKADVFVHNLAPGALERLGFGATTLRSTFPRLINCAISGYGKGGPLSTRKAYDLLIQSETGLVSITGTEATPSKVGISVADIAGGMYGYAAVLTALVQRQRTGEGTTLEVSLFDALAEWMGYPLYYAAYGSDAPQRTGAHHSAIAPYGPVTARDGRVVYLGIQNDREWVSFCEQVLERPDIARDARFVSNTKRIQNRAALDAIIEARIADLPEHALLERLDRAKIAHARLNTVQEFLAHPQLSGRDRWREVDSPVGPVRALLPPLIMEGLDPVMGPIPDVGEHTSDILTELGFEAPTIDTWRQAGVI